MRKNYMPYSLIWNVKQCILATCAQFCLYSVHELAISAIILARSSNLDRQGYVSGMQIEGGQGRAAEGRRAL